MSKQILSKQLQDLVTNEQGEKPSQIESYIKHLKDCIAKQPHLNARTDEVWLSNFLHGSKFNTEKVKAKLEFYYTIRKHTPEFYLNRNPFLPEIQRVLSKGIINMIIIGEAQNLHIVKWRNADPKTETLENIFKVILMLMDINMSNNQLGGTADSYVMIDVTDFNVNYLKQMTPTLCKKMCYILFKGYSLRLKGIFITNAPPIAVIGINMFRPFLPKKILSRMYLYSGYDYNEISKFILPSIIPKEYGGEGESLKNITVYSKNMIENNKDWFVEDEQYGTDETKRIGGATPSSDLFGLEGSFRKLNID